MPAGGRAGPMGMGPMTGRGVGYCTGYNAPGDASASRDWGEVWGVAINRDGLGDRGVDELCAAEGQPILIRIPFERAIAEGVAQGQMLVEIRPEYLEQFGQLYAQIAAKLGET